MSDKNQNIEELFQNAFEHFESDVSPGVWEKVSSQIQSPSAGVSDGGSSASTAVAGGTSIAKIAAVIGISGSLIAGGFWLASDSEEITEEKLDDKVEVYAEPNIASSADKSLNYEESDDQLTNESKIESPASTKEVVKEGEDTQNSRNDETVKEAVASDVKEEAPKANSVNTPKNTAQEEVKANHNITDEGTSKEIAEEKMDDKVDIKPQASIHASVKKGSIPLEIQFSSLDREAKIMSWNFGDGSDISNEEAPFHIFTEAGTYSVVLTVKGEDNWLSKDTLLINAKEDLSVFIPNVFSPNNDGINEVFKVEVEQEVEITSFECVVMDRSGKQVFRTTNLYSHWNGLDMNDNVCPQAQYLYIVKITTKNEPTEVLKGTVQLMR